MRLLKYDFTSAKWELFICSNNTNDCMKYKNVNNEIFHSLTTFINMYKNISEYIILCYSERKIITNVYGICIVAGSLH